MNTAIREGIDWVGYVDWGIRDFHGYRTERGSSYNSYLVRDDKSALVDTVKAAYVGQLLDNVSRLMPLEKINYIVCNHAEPDHSGGLPAVVAACPGADVVCDAKCREALSRHYDTSGWKFLVVKDGDRLQLGKRSLVFVETPMVHWPESMFTYVPEEGLLFSMDAFGQHYASSGRFDDEEPLDVVLAEAKTYYANIVMCYGKQIAGVLDRAGSMGIKTIAPSHGVIWRSHIGEILGAYSDWVQCKPKPKVLVIYDTMWKSTEKMAEAIIKGAQERSVDARLIYVRATEPTVIVTEVLDAATVALGSPTLNMTLMPEMAGVLTYLKGLKPQGKAGFAFGSYGWAKGGAKDVEEYMRAMKFELLREPLQVQYVPTKETLDECRAAGRLLADKAVSMTTKE
ncbi:MAG: MBL fold metallo-hydrolase [Verrucomicrobia bacterium]|nr:MBL fold metallo-hydrolase [Verrucomicrobiota bacterium]